MNKLMILTKAAEGFSEGSYMMLSGGYAFIAVPFDYKDTYSHETGGYSYYAELREFKDKIVKAVVLDWQWCKINEGSEAREATEEELETFLSMKEYLGDY